ncbi:MAG: 30S ribosomal protein S20 [Nitrospirae bacterium]|nr:30S ribosomal protein S20 [Nitrospirota bacterium]
MARHASPIKELRKIKNRRARNLYHLSHMMRSVKAVLRAIEEKESEKAKTLLGEAVARIQHTASRGVIHRNEANRRVSRLVRRFNAFLAEKTAPAASR